MSLRCVLTGSLEKVLPQTEPPAWPCQHHSLPVGDRLNVQIAYRLDWDDVRCGNDRLFFSVDVRSGIRVQLFQVALMPVRVACPADHDDDYLTQGPAMLPDLLLPYDAQSGVHALGGQWSSLWVQLRAEEPGDYEAAFTCRSASGECLWSQPFSLHVCSLPLPAQKLIHTEWFHADCLADYYGLDVFSEAHWQVIEQQIACAADHGVNMILTPVLTPALDTAIGGERTTVQLVDITEANGVYTFGLTKLDRWLDMCRRHGIAHIEICHLFTQWGAKHAPKVMVHTETGLVKRFGWETQATDPAYIVFLQQLIPAVKECLKRHDYLKNSWFHISDEPTDEDAQDYAAARSAVLPLLQDVHVVDALSSFAMYQAGVVPKPIVATDHVEPFLAAQVPGLWVYYCVGQGRDVGNRFMSMPSRRNRILGVQLYLYRIEGFLHWGYNFYNSQYSLRHLDPFAETDAGATFASGDAFLVYPGADGCAWRLIRLEVLDEALHDLRALELLENLKGRAHVERLIRALAGQEITFRSYPRSEAFLYDLRSRVNQEIALWAQKDE